MQTTGLPLLRSFGIAQNAMDAESDECMSYQIFTDATADLSVDLLAGLPPLEIIPMPVTICGKEYTYGPEGDIDVDRFYGMQRDGWFAFTSQINPEVYWKHFFPVLEQGRDVLYLSFSSGMSGTLQSARICAEDLKEVFPERKIVCVDSLCGSVGLALLVHEALKKQAEGLSLQELTVWVEEHKKQVCHWFTVDQFTHLKHGGRVSGAAAAVGTVLQIKPMLHINDVGTLEVAEKPRGHRKAMIAQINRMKQGWTPDEMGNTVIIGHGDCPDRAADLMYEVMHAFPNAEIFIADIGPIIGAHTGPGMLALIYWGNNR